MTTTTDLLRCCPRCLLRRFTTGGGLASHLRAHEREDGRRVRDLADRAAARVRSRYLRIDSLAQAVAYIVRELSAEDGAGYAGDRAEVLADAERVALDSLRRHPITDAVAEAVARWRMGGS